MKTTNLKKAKGNVHFPLVNTKITPLIECNTYLNFYPGAYDFPAGFFYDSFAEYKRSPHNESESFRWGFSPGYEPDNEMIDYVLKAHEILCSALRSLDNDQTINSC